MKTLTFVYGIGAALIIAGAVMDIFFDLSYGRLLIFLTIIMTSIYQGWIIDKLRKQLKK